MRGPGNAHASFEFEILTPDTSSSGLRAIVVNAAHPQPLRPETGSPSTPTATTGLAGVPVALVQATLDRVLASSTFRRSQRHRRFLEHIIASALAGRLEDLKEVIIGIDVFGRSSADFDPRRDPIVRVEAGRIREKLARFYEGEGAAEPYELSIPIGSYLPRVGRRRALTGPRPVIRPLAVLPFTDLSGHPDDTGFTAGLADQLIDTLGRSPSLRVVARFSAFKAREKESDLKAIGRMLDVTEVIEGSLQRSGNRVRCIAHLSRTKDGVRLWSQRFERDATIDTDPFAFQDVIADAVRAAVLGSHPTVVGGRPDEASGSLRAALSDNVKARDLFERAKYHAQQGTIAGFSKAIELLEKAVAIDPGFAQAHSQLGAAHANLAPYVFAPTRISFAKVKQASMRALELDPLDGDARALLGVIAHRIEAGWNEAEPMFREAVRIAPNSMLAHTAYAWGLVFRGQYADAFVLADRAIDIDPLNLGQRAYNARLHAYGGRHDRAIEQLLGVLDLEPDHLFAKVALGISYLALGRYDEAMPLFTQITEQHPAHPIAHLHVACTLGLQGDVEGGQRKLDNFLAGFGAIDHSRVSVACARACLGDRDGMLRDLEEAARVRDYLFTSVPANFMFDRYRSDPDYVALLRRNGLDLLPGPRGDD